MHVVEDSKVSGDKSVYRKMIGRMLVAEKGFRRRVGSIGVNLFSMLLSRTYLL